MEKLLLLPWVLLFVTCSGRAPVPVDAAGMAAALPVVTALPAPAVDSLLSVIGVGDVMLGTNYPSASYLPPSQGRDLLAEVASILRSADVTFGNHEGAILDSGGTPKTCRNPDACYVFRTPERFVSNLSDAGFDLMSIANNHSGDFGPEGRRRTKAVLREAGIEVAGLAGTDEQAIVERNGVRYGFCAFAPNSGTCDLRDIPAARAIVERLVSEADIVIVSFHGGAEGESHQHVPRRSEAFLGENRGNVHAFAHAVIDAGADVVFGHGPHVTRGVELYHDRFIAYSLGNFCTYGRFSLSGAAGIAPIIKVFLSRDGTFVRGEITPTYQQKTHGPKIDPNRRVTRKIIELSKTDFPDSPLRIGDDGSIHRQ
jgi:poly-gamma-glutamate capsule biosynthesis protein CapA/YwtB (metallophosphatase superfamily)